MTHAGVRWTPRAVEATRRAIERRLSVKWLPKRERRALIEALEALDEETHVYEPIPGTNLVAMDNSTHDATHGIRSPGTPRR